MANRINPFISILPLALLALAAWRLFDAGPLAAVASPAPASGKPGPPSKADLSFRDEYTPLDQASVFVTPAGPKGLEFTSQTTSLHGRKVRMSGWMVKHLHSDPRIFLLNASPLVLNMAEYGLADDLPPSAAHVILSPGEGFAPVWTSRHLEVCGVLELGPRQEMDGRISHLRLIADRVIDTAAGNLAELCRPIGLQPERVAAAARLSGNASASRSPLAESPQ